ncbi:hypothetical protein [Deinococcus sp. UYEF24]
MNRNALILMLALVSSNAFATDLRIYPTFTEVQQPASQELTFPSAQWRWTQPGSFSVDGGTLALSLQPAELDWIRTQEGKSVTWTPPGRAPVPATLERVDDLLLKLSTGEYVNAQRGDLTFSEKPPLQGGVTLKLTGLNTTKSSNLVHRTQALFWRPRYELNLNGAGINLAALAQLTNLSDQVFTAGKVDLYGGSVQQNPPSSFSQSGVMALPTLSVVSSDMSGLGNAGMNPVASVGEVRGLQRYTLPGGLQLGRGESLTLPFLKPQSRDFSRYASVQSYFDGQNHSGQVSRHYKFTSSLSLPTGPLDVREAGLLVGSVQLPAVQADKPVDLDLGNDSELRYEKTVKRTGMEKNDKAQLLSTSYQVTYRFVSTKATATRVSVREQLFGRSVSIEGQATQNGQVVLNRQVDVPANSSASLSFKLKLIN